MKDFCHRFNSQRMSLIFFIADDYNIYFILFLLKDAFQRMNRKSERSSFNRNFFFLVNGILFTIF